MFKSPCFLLTSAALLLSASSHAQTPLTTEAVITSGLSSPVWAGAPAGDDRVFVAEQNTADIKVVVGGAVVSTFLDATPIGLSTGGERGLLGVAFHPDYATNGLFYLNYTRSGGDTVIAEFSSTPGSNVSDGVASQRILMVIDQPFSNHNGGGIEFGPIDGYLYIGTGDGGSGNDPQCRAQNPLQLLGKMLRIDVNNTDPGLEYAIPADNPFVGLGTHREEIWAMGIRNPFRFGFDQLTGDMYIGDVGQDAREEIDVEPALMGGRNYGWRVMEGNVCNGLGACPTATTAGCFDSSYTPPVTTLSHAGGFGGPCAITGGEVYRGCAIPDLHGTYFFADFCDGQIRSFEWDGALGTNNFANRTSELDPPTAVINQINSFGRDGDNEILIVDQGGQVWRIVPETATFGTNVSSISVSAGGTQPMALRAGSAFGGQTYIVLGTVSGPLPGVPSVAGLILLTPDFYTNLTIATANTGPLVNTLGVLNASGSANASFTTAAGALPSSVVGLTAHHLYVTFDGAGTLTSASGCVSLDFLP